MVDYTKPAMRDESWRRWKGGKKLAEDLRIFYTSKSALDRIALNNAGHGLSAGKTRSNGGWQRLNLVQRLHKTPSQQMKIMQRRRDAVEHVEGSRVRVAHAPAAALPGQSSPKR